VYEYTYDAQGNQLTIKDPNGNITKFTYDDNGNQLTRTLPDESTEYFEYDFKGRIIKQISFEGVETIYLYDEFDRLVSKTFSVNGITETWTYTYDSFGRVSEINQNGLNCISYWRVKVLPSTASVTNEKSRLERIKSGSGG
jgi:YD repeat-containing protein